MDGTAPEAQAASFLSLLWPEMPDGHRILIWTLADKASHWAASVPEAADLALAAAGRSDVYVGVGLHRPDEALNVAREREEKKAAQEDRLPRQLDVTQTRGFTETATHLAGLWCDVDIAGAGHSDKKIYPPDVTAALELIDSMGVSPTLVVHSGGGLQAWWLFKELWDLTETGERERAQKLARGWSVRMKLAAEAKGWSIDSVHDLARVLRVPGTFNRKTSTPRGVTILRQAELRYDPSELEELAPEVSAAEEKAVASVVGPLKLSATAVPPWIKLTKLFSDEPLAQATFLRKRPDLKEQDASTYDFALTNYLVRGGFTDQEIVDTLITSRQTAGEDPKLRQDYYQNTIGKVRGDTAQSMSHAEAVTFLKEGDPKARPTTAEERSEILERLSIVIGCTIVSVIKLTGDVPEFRLRTIDGEVKLGTVGGLIIQHKFRQALAAAQGHLMPSLKAHEWDPIAQRLLSVCEELDAGEECTDAGMTKAWLRDYIEKCPPAEHSVSAIRAQRPFFLDGGVCFSSTHFRSFVLRRYGERVGHKEIGKLLRVAGAHASRAEAEEAGHRISRRVWWTQLTELLLMIPTPINPLQLPAPGAISAM